MYVLFLFFMLLWACPLRYGLLVLAGGRKDNRCWFTVEDIGQLFLLNMNYVMSDRAAYS